MHMSIELLRGASPSAQMVHSEHSKETLENSMLEQVLK